MPELRGLEGKTNAQLIEAVDNGARFVVYQYCLSLLIVSMKRPTDIHLVYPGQSNWGPRLGASAISLLAGWWGIPWGPIYTVWTISSNLAGGVDVTDDVLATLRPPSHYAPPRDPQLQRIFD